MIILIYCAFVLGSGECSVFNPATKSLEFSECTGTNYYVCQVEQVAHEDFIERMGWWPDYVHPMDNITHSSKEILVGFPETPINLTELFRPAFFIEESFMTDILPVTLKTTAGFTMGFWMMPVDDVTREQVIVGIDSQIFILLKNRKPSLKLCSDESCGTPLEVISHAVLEPNTWNYIAVAYETPTKMLKLYVNESYGLDNKEGHYEILTNNVWFGKQISEGEEGFTISFSTQEESKGYFGKISCVQIFSKYLIDSQIYKMSKTCHVPVDYPRAKACPMGTHKIGDYCYKLMASAESFTKAELSCALESLPDRPGRLGYPIEYQHQQAIFFFLILYLI